MVVLWVSIMLLLPLQLSRLARLLLCGNSPGMSQVTLLSWAFDTFGTDRAKFSPSPHGPALQSGAQASESAGSPAVGVGVVDLGDIGQGCHQHRRLGKGIGLPCGAAEIPCYCIAGTRMGA